MSKIPHLYRRDGGVYAVRFVVPQPLRIAVGSREIHRSTGCRDLPLAKVVAAQYAAEWYGRLADLRCMDPKKLHAGSVALLGDGDITLTEAAAELGADPSDLARRLVAQRSRFFVANRGWKGWVRDDVSSIGVERDETGAVIARDVSPQAFDEPGADWRVVIKQRKLQIYDPDEALAVASEPEPQTVCIFLVPPSRHMAFVVEFPGVELRLADLLVARSDVESLRRGLASQISPHLIVPVPPQLAMPDIDSIAKTQYQHKPVSALTKEYLERRSSTWKADEQRRQRDACSALVELIGDIALGRVTRDEIYRVGQDLAKLPHDRRRYRAKLGDRAASLRAMIDYANEQQLQRISPNAVRLLMEDICAVFRWGKAQQWLREDPTEGLTSEIFDSVGGVAAGADKRRDMFTDAELLRIFSMEWFRNGVGSKTKKGRYFAYRPHYFWLPLLAIYSGARINELSQLYLADLRREPETGIWYLDFNLDATDKINADGEEDEADAMGDAVPLRAGRTMAKSETDKSLKTENAIRRVPLHSKLIDLGLLRYADALRMEGHQRLFPELKFDPVKGYGKAAGRWFNERLLGRTLEMERDGRKVFHSFRHNVVTALERAGVPDKAVKQIVGHARADKAVAGATLGYQKARALSELTPHIESLAHVLPPIAPFDVEEGLVAVRDALALKKRQPKRP